MDHFYLITATHSFQTFPLSPSHTCSLDTLENAFLEMISITNLFLCVLSNLYYYLIVNNAISRTVVITYNVATYALYSFSYIIQSSMCHRVPYCPFLFAFFGSTPWRHFRASVAK